jgi:hypothetical protein
MKQERQMTKIITWQSPSGHAIAITRRQEKMMRKAGFWPRDSRGGEFCSVSHGLHIGQPTWTDAQVEKIIQIEVGRTCIEQSEKLP